MARKLQKVIKQDAIPKLARNNEPFRLSIETRLDNGFELSDIDSISLKEFHRFVTETIYKNMTISDVDKRYLRKKDSNLDERESKNIIHYGKDGSPFRLFGYYNDRGYFVLTRIDGKHKTHRQ